MSNLFGPLENGIRENVLNGIGSGIAYSGYGNTYYLLADRGPSSTSYKNGGDRDETTRFWTRFQSFDITLTGAGNAFAVKATNVGTTLFTNEFGASLVGASDQFSLGNSPDANRRFDPESIRVSPLDGSLYVSDEFGPSVYHFRPDGVRIGVLPVPVKFLISSFTYSGRSNNEVAWNPNAGRIANKGIEGLAITPDGKLLLATMQAPLAQDGGDNTRRTRFILFDLTNPTGTPKEFLYLLDEDSDFPGMNVSKTSVSDAVAINNHQFLIDEREGGDSNKKGYIIDIDNAVDISGMEALAGLTEAAARSMAITKGASAFISLKGLTGNQPNGNVPVPAGYLPGMPDNIEGFTFGPDLPDGRHLLLVTNDNDFLTTGYPNYIMAFAIDPASLPSYQALQFPIVPGGFSGDVLSQGVSVGTLSATQTSSRAVSGKLVLNGKTFVLRGKANIGGLFTQTFHRKGLPDLIATVTFALDANGLASLSARIASGADTYIVGSTVAFSKVPLTQAPIGRYNCKLGGGASPDQPAGTGWSSFVIAKTGTLRGVVRLPDNTPVSFGTQLKVDGTARINATLYAKPRGSFVADLTFASAPVGDVSGTFTLTKPPQTSTKGLFPGGFTLSNPFTGGLLKALVFPNPTVPTAEVIFSGGFLESALTQNVNVAVNGVAKTVLPLTVPMTLKIAPSTGLMSGTFTPAGEPRTAFTGVVIGPGNFATGIFAGKTQTGMVTVTPQD
ncbi:MAG: hypothetical protein JWL59_209 [Chthoniobacteraceae bacterium]|nr:hypothetical protein [Chthoniobacteraceae bacterium]